MTGSACRGSTATPASPHCSATKDNGRWLIASVEPVLSVSRRYRSSTLILETTFETLSGSVCLIDFMSRRAGACDLVRITRRLTGKVEIHTGLTVRFDMGSVVAAYQLGHIDAV